jgi:DNA-damage-inducible protein J
MASTTIRFDDELKAQATDKLNKIGMSLNTYVVLALRQLVTQNKVPFEIDVPQDTKEISQELYQTMIRVQAEELGLIPDSSRKIDLGQLRKEIENS